MQFISEIPNRSSTISVNPGVSDEESVWLLTINIFKIEIIQIYILKRLIHSIIIINIHRSFVLFNGFIVI